MAKRPNGAGSIFPVLKDGKPTGKFFVQVRVTRPGGEPRTIRRTAYGKANANALLLELQALANKMSPDRYTVAAWLDCWFEAYCREHAPATRDQYRRAIDDISAVLGRTQLDALRAPEIRDLLRQWDKNPRKRQVRYKLLRQALEAAVEDDIIAKNPARKVDCPTPKRKRPRPFNPAECRTLLDGTENTPLHAFVVLGLTLGLRPGELLGLRWATVDLAAGHIDVEQVASEVSGKLYIRRPKTDTSLRRVLLPRLAIDALHEHRKLQLRAGAAGDIVFPATEGGYQHRSTLSARTWKPALEHLGLPIRGLHQLRHSYATCALGAGIPVHVVAAVLGHSKPSITLDVYSHAIPSQQEAAAAGVNRLFAAG